MPNRRSIFLSYRRQESSHVAGRLADRLSSQFGEAHVFMDVDSIPPGRDFAEAIEHALNECAVLLALIGPTWTSAVDARGRRRLDDPNDLVVIEIQIALDRAIPVIPVLVDGATAPTREDLPASLGALARRQALRIDHDTFRADCAALLGHVTRLMAEAGEQEDREAGQGRARREQQLRSARTQPDLPAWRGARAVRTRRHGALRILMVLGAAFAVVAVGSVLAVFYLATPRLDTVAVQDRVQRVLTQDYGLAVDAAVCPEGIEVAAGATFECLAMIGGEKVTVPVRITSADGNYEVGPPS